MIPFFIAIFLAILCAPPVAWLQRHRIPTTVAVIVVVVVAGLLLVSVAAVVGGSVRGFTDSIPVYQQRLDAMADSASDWLAQAHLPFGLELPWDGEISQIPRTVRVGSLMGWLGTGLKGLLAALSNTLLVVLTLVFMLLEAAAVPVKVKVALGRDDADISRFAKITHEVQQYLAIKTGLSLTTGLLIGFWLAIVGLDFAVVWGLLAFLLNYIPNIGSIVAAVPAILLALVQLGPGHALAVLVGFVVVNVSIGNILEPQLMGRRLGLSALVVFLSLVFWGWMWGPVGMLLSVPLTMIVKIFFENFEDLRWLGVFLDSRAGAEAKLLRLRESARSGAATETAGVESPDGP